MASPKHEIFSSKFTNSAQNSKSTGVSIKLGGAQSFNEKDLMVVKDLVLPDGAIYNGQVRKCDEGI